MQAIVVFDIDGVIRDVGGSYRRALADTVEAFTRQAYRPSQTDIDALKAEGVWNNDWEGSQELIYRYFAAQGQPRTEVAIDYSAIVAFFQSRYRGTDPTHWTGYICQEPLLAKPAYFQSLSEAEIAWGFFSGATTGSARYVLEKRLGLSASVLVAMEDAPGKPDPTGLFQTIAQLESNDRRTPVIYAGDTVADIYTIINARQVQPDRPWVAVGILPPHVQDTPEHAAVYQQTLTQAGADLVLSNIQELSVQQIEQLI